MKRPFIAQAPVLAGVGVVVAGVAEGPGNDALLDAQLQDAAVAKPGQVDVAGQHFPEGVDVYVVAVGRSSPDSLLEYPRQGCRRYFLYQRFLFDETGEGGIDDFAVVCDVGAELGEPDIGGVLRVGLRGRQSQR